MRLVQPVFLLQWAFAALALWGCGAEDTPGAVVTLGVVHNATPILDAQSIAHGIVTPTQQTFPHSTPKSFDTAEGVHITLTSAYAVVETVELTPCPGSLHSAWRRLLRELSPIATAWAHGETTPTRFGAPHVQHLLDHPLEINLLGTLEPPQGSYCGLHVTLGPADDDAHHLPTDVDMVGTTLYLEGTFAANGAEPVAFSLQTSERRFVEIDLPATLVLDASSQKAVVLIGLAYASWLDGVDLSASSDATLAQAALDRAAASLHSPPYLGE